MHCTRKLFRKTIRGGKGKNHSVILKNMVGAMDWGGAKKTDFFSLLFLILSKRYFISFIFPPLESGKER